jgi:tetratricopeptide (TPR) repeat protein
MQRHILMALVFTVLLLAGCATRTVQTTVLRPAQINLVGYDRVLIGRIDGDGADAMRGATLIRAKLLSRIANSGQYTIVDRESLHAAMDERELQMMGVTGQTDQSGYTAASTLVSGTVFTHQYNQWRTSYQAQDGTYWQTHLQAKVSALLKVIDLDTMEILATDTLETVSQEIVSGSIYGGSPDLDPAPAYEQCYEDLVSQFMKKIAPYSETVPVTLYLVGDAPSTRSGYGFFTAQNYGQARSSFQEAVEFERNNPKQNPGRLSKVIYNCGVAHEYCNEFDEALQCYEEALRLNHDSKYVEAINRIQRLRQEYQEKIDQGLVSPE